jgi:hypothetical protein
MYRFPIMNSLPLLTFSFFMLMSSPGNSQDPNTASVRELNNSFHEAYGPDQHLVCGVRYFNLHRVYDGHKFFMEDKFVKGKLILEHGIYPNVSMKYDLYGQQLILQAISPDSDTYNEIIVTDSRLKGFELEGRTFRKLHFPETDTMIFQVIGQGDPECLYHWEKEVLQYPLNHYRLFSFSKMHRKSYVVTNSSLHSFKKARSFSKIFPDHRAEVKKYIRRQKIRLTKAGDAEMTGLINYCSNIIKEGSRP